MLESSPIRFSKAKANSFAIATTFQLGFGNRISQSAGEFGTQSSVLPRLQVHFKFKSPKPILYFPVQN